MQINVLDPVFQTTVFMVLFLSAILLTVSRIPRNISLTPSHTDQLKGLAILMVIFSHLGYFLSSDHRYLYPLSVAGGVGVDLFLFLSGLGLTLSTLKNRSSILGFYQKRLGRLFIPMWIVIVLFLVLDYFLLNRSYPLSEIYGHLIGWFPRADLSLDLNSPLWYFTFILFYYLIFPLVFFRKWPLLSAVLILLAGYVTFNYVKLPVVPDVLKLYQLHYLAFPLGVSSALLQNHHPKVLNIFNKTIMRVILIIFFATVFSYTAIHSGVGQEIKVAQLISLETMFSAVFLVILLPVQSEFIGLLGTYSYGIYLIHWPILFRYDFLYKNLPAFLATLLYLLIFLILGFLFNQLVKLIFSLGR